MHNHHYHGCTHYGTQFEKLEKKQEKHEHREHREEEFMYTPLYMRLRRHSIGRRYYY